MMNIAEVQDRIDAVVSTLAGKGHKDPHCHLDLKSGGRVSAWTHTTCGVSEQGEHHYADCAEDALQKAEAWADAWEDAETAAKRLAVKAFGESIDGLRNAGVEADFVDPLSDALQAMTENLLTDQRTAAE